ncbi:MAG TPA: sulfurtransferase [Thermoanaerobaculia bacterium]
MALITPLVTPSWLADHLHDPDLLVFDASYYLPTEGKDAEAEFAKAHIPGAARFDVDAIKDAVDPLPHMVPTPARFAALVGALGIHNGARIVVYDQKGIFSAPRAWWLMRLFGHDQAFVLDGGLPLWLAEGRPTESGPAKPRPKAEFHPSYRPRLLRGLGDMADNLASKAELVLDARSAARFHAEAPEPRAGLRAGHIPGARSLPARENIDAAGRFLPVDELRSKLAAVGVDGTARVVSSCGSGVTACHTLLVMEHAGVGHGRLYPGSWSQWSSDPERPIETGEDVASHRVG